MYSDGRGVTADTTEAARWFHRAAVQDVARTQYDSRVVYANSREVAQDDVTIHLWFDLAVARSTGDIRDSVVQSRTTVAQRMTRNQITEARRRAPTGAGKSSHWTAFLPAVEF
jgi:TPR repeat protein